MRKFILNSLAVVVLALGCAVGAFAQGGCLAVSIPPEYQNNANATNVYRVAAGINASGAPVTTTPIFTDSTLTTTVVQTAGVTVPQPLGTPLTICASPGPYTIQFNTSNGGGGFFNYNIFVPPDTTKPGQLTGSRAQLTADFTDANSAALQVITGLSFAIPSTYVGNLSFHCGLAFSQATPVAGDQFGVALLTTAPTRLDAVALVATNVTTTQFGPLTNLATTTPTAIVTFTAVPTTVLPAFIDGTVQVAGGGAATLQFYVLNGTAANVIVVRAGSFCTVN